MADLVVWMRADLEISNLVRQKIELQAVHLATGEPETCPKGCGQQLSHIYNLVNGSWTIKNNKNGEPNYDKALCSPKESNMDSEGDRSAKIDYLDQLFKVAVWLKMSGH